MQNTTPTSLSLESVSTDLLELVQGGCHKHRRWCCPQGNTMPAGAPAPSAAPGPSCPPIFQQIMQIPPQLLQGYGQQQTPFDPSQFAAQGQPQSGGEVQTRVQVAPQ